MVGPRRPQFVLFGSSIVQMCYNIGGWGATLADLYARKVPIFCNLLNNPIFFFFWGVLISDSGIFIMILCVGIIDLQVVVLSVSGI